MSKTKIQIARLEKLATHLENGKLGHAKFDFAVVNTGDAPGPSANGCGTAGCAMGECPIVFRRHWKFGRKSIDGQLIPYLRGSSSGWLPGDVGDFFGISYAMHKHLFHPHHQYQEEFGGYILGEGATAKQVARNIRIFVKRAKAGKFNGYSY